MNIFQRVRFTDIFLLICRCVIGGVFLFAAMFKATDMLSFFAGIERYGILPIDVIPSFAVTIVFIEATFGIALMVGFYTRLSAVVLSGMLIAFIVALSIAVLEGKEIDCGCFGASTHASPIETIIRDVFLLIALSWVAFNKKKTFALDNYFFSQH